MGRGLSFVSVDVCLEECTVVTQGLACPRGYVKWDYINNEMIVDCRITFLTDTGLLDQQINMCCYCNQVDVYKWRLPCWLQSIRFSCAAAADAAADDNDMCIESDYLHKI
jgi:hypothetical protein